MISYCLLKGRQGDPKCRGSSPKVRAGIWGASPTPEPSLVLCLPGHSSSKAGVPGWNPGPGGSPVPLCQTHTGKSSKMKWANMCQMSIPSQHSDAFFFFFFENMEAAEVRESPSQEYWTGSQECSSSPVLAPIPPTGSTDILDRVSPRTHSSSQVLQFLWTYSDWCRKESQTLLRKSLKP